MSKARLCLTTFVGVLVISAFASSVASAGWMVNGTNFVSGTKALATTVAVEPNQKSELSAAGIIVDCEARPLGAVNPAINGATGMADATSLEFVGCEVSTGMPPCKLAVSMNNTIKTLPLLVDLTLGENPVVKGRFLSTNSSKLFATMQFEGGECSFAGPVQPVTGAATFEAPLGQLEKTTQKITITGEEPGSLKLGKNNAVLLGAYLLRLASGETFSFL